jgi:bifunctional DNA-binding transcriptional regulator/antitoxin component of YhaV-PrlF toxin-antitoxin module
MRFAIVMYMQNVITITSKGQTTLPANMRHKFGLGKAGGILQATFDDEKIAIIISRPTDATELSQRLSRYIKSNTRPLADVDSYYQANRTVKK